MKQRIYILGTSASGKSTLAEILSEKLNVPVYHLDDIFWYKKYSRKRNEKKRDEMISKIIGKKRWIIEGVYGSWTEKGIKKSDLVIWLDFPFRILSLRILRRFLKEKNKKTDENWKNIFRLIKYVKKYKKGDHGSSYKSHKTLIDEYKVNTVIIKNKKQLNNFLRTMNLK